MLLITGCTGLAAKWERGGWPSPVTVQGRRTLVLWQGALVAALCVGAIVIGLILFACFRFRKRSDELPRQVRYNIPIEVLYTTIPTVIVAFLFYFTARQESYEDRLPKHPALTVGVVGFQWEWQFNYPAPYNLQITGRPGQDPTLVIPTHKVIEFYLTSPDVIHAFWVVPFLFKRDVIPGRINAFAVTVDRAGTFVARCAEYCGTDHDRMTAYVKAVPWSQFLAFVSHARKQAASSSPGLYTLVGSSTSGSTP
jgi:cytochrome c oxidase subunit 2